MLPSLLSLGSTLAGAGDMIAQAAQSEALIHLSEELNRQIQMASIHASLSKAGLQGAKDAIT